MTTEVKQHNLKIIVKGIVHNNIALFVLLLLTMKRSFF